MRHLTSFATLLLATLPLACAAPCKRVASSHAEHQARTPTAASPHVSLAIPLATVDRFIAAEVRRLPTLKQQLPAVAGVSLGSVALRVERVTTRPAAAGLLGFSIRVGLSRGKERIMAIDVQAVVKPVIDPRKGTVSVALEGKNIQSLRPVLAGGAADSLANVVWRQLPEAAKMFTSKKQVAQLTAGVANDIMRSSFALVKRELLDDLGRITRVELDLPDLPLQRVELTTTKRDLVLAAWTTLPVADGLAAAGRASGAPAAAAQLRVSGATAAELGNYAMKIGEIPARWKLDGTPDPAGPLHVALGWEAGAKPLQVHLWQLEGDCAHVRVDARPSVAVQGQHLLLKADDARVASVDGSLKVRAGIWFGGVGRQSFAFVEQTTAKMKFSVGGQTVTATVQGATLANNELTLSLGL